VLHYNGNSIIDTLNENQVPDSYKGCISSSEGVLCSVSSMKMQFLNLVSRATSSIKLAYGTITSLHYSPCVSNLVATSWENSHIQLYNTESLQATQDYTEHEDVSLKLWFK
jgi:hypothetical protein